MIDINKVKIFCNKHYFAVVIFIFSIVHSFIIFTNNIPNGVSSEIYAIHAVDFGLGFCSKLLPGAIYNIFFDSVSSFKTTAYLFVLLLLFYVVLSFVLEKFILKIKEENRKTAFIILAFLLTGPVSLALHSYYPGMLDMYWVFCALLFFVLLSAKQLKPLIFLPFVLCVTVYFASLLCFIPFFAIILLYEISCTQEKKQKALLWVLFIVSVVAAVGLGGYFAIFEENNLALSIEEFHEIYSKRGLDIDHFFYFDQSLYKDIESFGYDEFEVFELKSDSAIERILWEIALRINYNLTAIGIKDKLVIFALAFPLFSFILWFMLSQAKVNFKSKNILKGFANVCMVILPFFTIFTSVLFSEDIIRWISHGFITLTASFIFILYNEGDQAWNWVREKIEKIPFVALLFYFIFNATTIYSPYYSG